MVDTRLVFPSRRLNRQSAERLQPSSSNVHGHDTHFCRAEALPSSAAPHLLDDLYRLTVDEYDRLAEAGVLKDRRVELINGWLVKKMTTKPPHVVAVDATRESLARILPPGWWLREEKPVRIPEFDEPEPDISVVRGSRQDYLLHHPGPGDIEFLAEVADTSLTWDRHQKLCATPSAACRPTGS